jgi:hypothetical protein
MVMLIRSGCNSIALVVLVLFFSEKLGRLRQ